MANIDYEITSVSPIKECYFSNLTFFMVNGYFKNSKNNKKKYFAFLVNYDDDDLYDYCCNDDDNDDDDVIVDDEDRENLLGDIICGFMEIYTPKSFNDKKGFDEFYKVCNDSINDEIGTSCLWQDRHFNIIEYSNNYYRYMVEILDKKDNIIYAEEIPYSPEWGHCMCFDFYIRALEAYKKFYKTKTDWEDEYYTYSELKTLKNFTR